MGVSFVRFFERADYELKVSEVIILFHKRDLVPAVSLPSPSFENDKLCYKLLATNYEY